MKPFIPKTRLAALWVVLVLLSCSGGGGHRLIAGGGIDGTGIISQGPISSYGSIVVNGTEFDTSGAEIIVDEQSKGVGDQVVRSNLKIGMVVTVEGISYDDQKIARAARVIYHENLQGPVESVESIDPSTKKLTVLGQIVLMNALTRFEATDLNTLAPGDVISVSGFFNDQGDIWATFLQRRDHLAAGPVYKVTGYVVDLNTNLEFFAINGLRVVFSRAIVNGLPDSRLVQGLFVEVEGTLDADSGILHATRIVPGDVLEAEDVDTIEVIGFVTQRDSSFQFRLGNQRVRVNPKAQFVDGTAADVVLGTKLEAEGTLEGGILMADEIEFWRPDQVEVEGFVTDVASTLEFSIGSQMVQIDGHTVFENGTAADLGKGILVEVKGVPVDRKRNILLADKVSFEEE